jgi:4-amino-4-deoxy-L-arabinose transferase-like glycosyltransferase
MPPEHQPSGLSTRQGLTSAALATLLAAIVLLTLLGHNRLTDWDEGIYAQVSREMLTTGWLVPHWNTQLWLEKPPLTFWITALFFKLFGVSEFTARLGSALSAVTLVVLLNGWLAHRRDRLTAWLSTLILLTTFGFLHTARVGETDVLLSLGCLLALIGVAELYLSPASPLPWYLYWIGFSIALLAKGAASATILFTLLALVLLDRTLFRRLRLHFFLGFALFLALVLPWHLYLYHLYGQLFLDQYLGLHVIGRVTHQYDGHISHWWYYLRVLLVSAPPFVLLYPFALYDALTQQRLRYLRAFALFAILEITLVSFVQTRLPHYIAPAYAPLTALTAIWLADHFRLLSRPTSTRLKLATAAIAIWIIAALLTAAPRKSLHSPRLPNGNVTPNNREEVALLKQVFQHPTPEIASTPGPLLDWRPVTYNPIPTTVFYANRPVQQVQLQPLAPNTPTDIYAFNPLPLAQIATTQPRLIFLDRSLLPTLPSQFLYHPIASSQTGTRSLEVGTIALRP